MPTEEVDIWSDSPELAPDPPKAKRKRGRPASERLYTLALKKTNVGWRLYIAEVPESTIDNHIIERFEPDLFEMVLGKIESLLTRKMLG